MALHIKVFWHLQTLLNRFGCGAFPYLPRQYSAVWNLLPVHTESASTLQKPLFLSETSFIVLYKTILKPFQYIHTMSISTGEMYSNASKETSREVRGSIKTRPKNHCTTELCGLVSEYKT